MSLLRILDGDLNFARSMRDLGIDLERTPRRLALWKPPTDWTWHHALDPVVMQLVPRTQHTPGSIFRNTVHPGGKGGCSILGK